MSYVNTFRTSSFGTPSGGVATITFDSTGSTMIIFGVTSSAGSVWTDFTENKSNTFTKVQSTSSGDAEAHIYVSPTSPTVGASHTISYTYPASSNSTGLYVAGFSGGWSNTLVDSSTVIDDNNVSSKQPGASDPTAADQIAIALMAIRPDNGNTLASTLSVDSSFVDTSDLKLTSTQFQAPTGFPQHGGQMAYYINPPVASLNPTFSLGPASNSVGIVLVILGAPPATGTWKTENGVIVLPSGSRTMKNYNGTAIGSTKTKNGLTT